MFYYEFIFLKEHFMEDEWVIENFVLFNKNVGNTYMPYRDILLQELGGYKMSQIWSLSTDKLESSRENQTG